MDDLLIPLPQSPEFARTCAHLGLPVRGYTCQGGGELRGLWQVQSRTLPLIGRVDLISRGPVWREARFGRDWLARWQRRHDGRPLVLNADGMEAVDLRRAGFWPLMTPVSLALCDLAPGGSMRARLHQKWRNRLVRAEAAELSVTLKPLSRDHWLLRAEAVQQRAKGYRGLPPTFAAAYAAVNPGCAWAITAEHGDGPVAGGVFLRHGAMATYQIGFSSDAGRALNAMNLVLWHAMEALSEAGVRRLDLGTLNTQDAAGLARFKLGTGAQMHRLGGTWLHLPALAGIARHLPARFAA